MSPAAGRRLWAALELLDRQIVDHDGRMAGKVDDIEFEVPDAPGGLPIATAILSGPGALAGQIGGATGKWLAAVDRRLSESGEPSSIAFSLVRSIDSAVVIAAGRAELESNRGERWASDVLVSKIPGAGHETE